MGIVDDLKAALNNTNRELDNFVRGMKRRYVVVKTHDIVIHKGDDKTIPGFPCPIGDFDNLQEAKAVANETIKLPEDSRAKVYDNASGEVVYETPETQVDQSEDQRIAEETARAIARTVTGPGIKSQDKK